MKLEYLLYHGLCDVHLSGVRVRVHQVHDSRPGLCPHVSWKECKEKKNKKLLDRVHWSASVCGVLEPRCAAGF